MSVWEYLASGVLSSRPVFNSRAIFSPRSNHRAPIDIVVEHTGFSGEKNEDHLALRSWLVSAALPTMQEEVITMSPTSHAEYIHTEGDFIVKATPNGSDGYLYIVAGFRK